MTTEGSFDFAGKLKLPLPDKHGGNPSMCGDWSWNFKTYISMFDNTVKACFNFSFCSFGTCAGCSVKPMLPILGHVMRRTLPVMILTWLNSWYPRWWMLILGSCLIQELQPVALGTLHLTGHCFHFRGSRHHSNWFLVNAWMFRVENLLSLNLLVFSRWLHFYVCYVLYSVLSVSRLLLQATRLNLDGKVVLWLHLLGKEWK